MEGAKKLVKCICGCDKLSEQTIKSFTENINNVLSNEEGRQVFQKYMAAQRPPFKNGRKLLKLWEKCDSILKSDVQVPFENISEIMEEAEDITGLDFNTMEKLNRCLEEKVYDSTLITIQELKENSKNILNKHEYKKFSEYLIKK